MLPAAPDGEVTRHRRLHHSCVYDDPVRGRLPVWRTTHRRWAGATIRAAIVDDGDIVNRPRNPVPVPVTDTPGSSGGDPDLQPTVPFRSRRPAPQPPSDDEVRSEEARADDLHDAGEADPSEEARADSGPREPVIRNLPRLVWRTIKNAWDHGIVGWAAQAAFWQALSFPPLLLGLLGSIGYVAGWFGPDTVNVISERIISFSNRTFSESVVADLIEPTVENVLGRGRVGIVSLAFILSLWAGSSAVSCFVASIVRAHDQHEVRNPVWQRFFALFLYIGFLTVSVLLLPLVALGPNYLREIVPSSWDPAISDLIDIGYFPAVAILMLFALTTLYHLALPNPLPWHRLVGGAVVAGVFFWVASYILRIYLTAVTRAGYTYGALATPIAFLLFTFFLGFAIVIGAEFNAAVQSIWPAKPAATAQVRDWVSSQTSDITGQLKTIPDRLASGPIRRPRSTEHAERPRRPESGPPSSGQAGR